MQQRTTILVPKSSDVYNCEICDYLTSRKSQYDRHILTTKHKRLQRTTILVPNSSKYKCKKCNNSYKHNSSLWKHNKTCCKADDITDKDLIMTLIKQNSEILDELKIVTTKNAINNTTNNNITTNSHNKTFNLQFFLNETCKDALNITEFVSSIKMQITDLETTGRRGYVEGVSRIINKNLKELDMFKRPIHCSDLKRETLYIKNDNEWKKENDDKPLLTNAIKQVANENIRQIGEWKKEHPDCTDSASRQNDLYLKIVSNAMSGGTSEEQSKNYEKIISNIAKEVVIDK